MRALLWSLVLVVGGSVTGCGHRPQVVTDHVAGAAPAWTPGANVLAGICIDDTGCSEQKLCLHSHCVAIGPGVAECGIARVSFATNSATLRQQDVSKLKRMTRCLKADQELHVTIEGYTDERGTIPANERAGARRAEAVARYLESQGVSADQLRRIDYGEEQPLCPEHDEPCWSLNRRATLRPWAAQRSSAGGPM